MPGGSSQSKVKPRFLLYGLRDGKDDAPRVYKLEHFHLHDVPLRHPVSFLDFDGVVLFVGCFEQIPSGRLRIDQTPRIECALSDLDRRDKQFHTMLIRERPFIFLVKPIPHQIGFHELGNQTDLFRRVMGILPIAWNLIDRQVPHLDSRIPEFRPFLEKYGAARVVFRRSHSYNDDATIIIGHDDDFIGFEVVRRVFFLPCYAPNSHEEARDMAVAAIQAVMAYRVRMSEDMPEWAAAFQFKAEVTLREKMAQRRKEVVRLEMELEAYAKRKGALCWRSEPLVDVVVSILETVFGVKTKTIEKCIEDALVLDDDGNTIAVMEIKGVNDSFRGKDVNQVDSHREELGFTAETPGILIMNTKASATSLTDKDEAAHPRIITKAVKSNVLMIRTLDLLRYADLLESGKLTKEDFRSTILSKHGWLKVEGGAAEVVQE